MRAKSISILAVLVIVALVGSISAANVQQAYAPRDCPGCVAFKKTTHDFEKAVINAIGNPDVTPPDPVVRGLLQTYAEDVNRIFLGGPDTIPVLLGDYQQKVLSLLTAPPEPDKHAGIPSGIDFVTDLHILTHDFEKAVINAVTDPED